MDPIPTELVVIGAGPGGYAAAFYAADLGKKVILVERDNRLGGVCMNRGCIPSKALLNATHAIHAAKESARRGILFGEPKLDLDQLRTWKNSILEKLGGGIASLAKMRGVTVLNGRGHFEDSTTLRVESAGSGNQFIRFEQAIVAVGSRPALPRAWDLGNPRVMTSTEALEVPDVPEKLLVIGGGYIGMELGTVYASLGSQVTVIEALDGILAGADPDLVRPVALYAKKAFKEVRLKAKVNELKSAGKQLKVVSEFNGQPFEELYDRVLVSVGRAANGQDLGLENTKVERDERGFIKVNERMQSTDPNIYAIGDIAGGIMLAHKASKEARIAVDNLAGETGAVNRDYAIPAVVFTDPEIAWVGLTEQEAKQKGIRIEVAKFPWGASGRALTYDRVDGLTKLIMEPETHRVLGVGLVGHGAGELIGEGAVAVEMGATAEDLAAIVHPHPTLSETIMECAEAFLGHATHVFTKKKLAAEG
ncbi:MAG TPA: dihydrolipoyl dehydrogenase [Verrucomicrobiota bacterium]|nr:dihydrolipoyl dehydrogenase [Verrucomicrobiales bacterium]HRI11920.1 dihydrolipoyl dehydrogenase [Verrucomicrobiota bacterium]